MDITICSDYTNNEALDQLIFEYANASEECEVPNYKDHSNLFKLIAMSNIFHIDDFIQFADLSFVKNFTGDNLLRIAITVSSYNKNKINLCLNKTKHK